MRDGQTKAMLTEARTKFGAASPGRAGAGAALSKQMSVRANG
jgi:hypothetical protein